MSTLLQRRRCCADRAAEAEAIHAAYLKQWRNLRAEQKTRARPRNPCGECPAQQTCAYAHAGRRAPGRPFESPACHCRKARPFQQAARATLSRPRGPRDVRCVLPCCPGRGPTPLARPTGRSAPDAPLLRRVEQLNAPKALRHLVTLKHRAQSVEPSCTHPVTHRVFRCTWCRAALYLQDAMCGNKKRCCDDGRLVTSGVELPAVSDDILAIMLSDTWPQALSRARQRLHRGESLDPTRLAATRARAARAARRRSARPRAPRGRHRHMGAIMERQRDRAAFPPWRPRA